MVQRTQTTVAVQNRSVFYFTICCVLVFSQGSYTQTASNTRTAEIKREIAERTSRLAPSFPPTPGLYGGRDRVLRTDIEKALAIEPKQAYIYGPFLDEDGTGIFRLLPANQCISGKKLLRGECGVQKSLIVRWGNGYSLRARKHIDVKYADFNLADGKIEATSTMVQTILTQLGSQDISSLDLTSPGIRFLSEFVPETEVLKARQQFEDLTKGHSEESGPDSARSKFVYSKSVPVKLGDVYAVRSIFYNSEMFRSPEFDKVFRKHNLDIIAVFKVVKVDQNGAVTILWKELSSKNAPFFTAGEPK